jgi:oligopeptide/dipeptide ABC transporter ATP-binding protein
MEILVVEDLKTWFPIKNGIRQRTIGHIKAVDGVSLRVRKGETYGLVGESGCGKTTLAKSILQLVKPTSGLVRFDGIDITANPAAKKIRHRIQIVFQDPYASLDPRKTVLSALTEPIRIHGLAKSNSDASRVASELIVKVGLNREHLYRYPHEFSGGQRQRIAIARALAVEPEFIILDEPTSFLDVSVQAQVLDLLKELQRELQLTYIFVSHNLSVVQHMSDRVGVMYLGKIVEEASRDTVYKLAEHPYSHYLITAIPVPDPQHVRKEKLLGGDVPSPVNIPSGCRFRPRCPYVTERCAREEPKLYSAGKLHLVACHYKINFKKNQVAKARAA